MQHITQKDIAQKLNVTRITVSKALRNHPDISKEMKLKVKEMAKELGYSPNMIAKQLITRKTNVIGVIVPDLENSFFAYMVDSMIDAVAERNYNLVLTVSREKEANEIKNIQNLIGMRVDGILACVSQETCSSKNFQQITQKNIPLVFFDRNLTDLNVSSVVFDDKEGAFLAINQIISDGYSKIAHIAGYQNTTIGKLRADGYINALNSNNIVVNTNWVLEGGFEVEDGYNAAIKLIQTNNLPEIIFAVNDRVALGAYRALQKAGIPIPEEVGILAFGFEETTELFTPSLTVINQNPRILGKQAANLLLDEIHSESKEKYQTIFIEEKLSFGKSVLFRNSKC